MDIGTGFCLATSWARNASNTGQISLRASKWSKYTTKMVSPFFVSIFFTLYEFETFSNVSDSAVYPLGNVTSNITILVRFALLWIGSYLNDLGKSMKTLKHVKKYSLIIYFMLNAMPRKLFVRTIWFAKTNPVINPVFQTKKNGFYDFVMLQFNVKSFREIVSSKYKCTLNTMLIYALDIFIISKRCMRKTELRNIDVIHYC